MTKDNYLKEELYQLIKEDKIIFDFIQESSLDGLWYWDLENPENEWMNEQFWVTLGYDPQDMPHKAEAWQGIINQDDLQVAQENFTAHCQDPSQPYNQIVRYTHKNASTVWIQCRGLAIRDEHGKPVRMLGAHHDITDIKKAEIKLIELNAQKDKFFSIIAHDMRSPMSGILGFSNLLLDQVKQKDYEGIEKYAEIIQQSSQRTMDLLNSLLEWSFSESGRMKFNPENFEMVTLMDETILLFKDFATQKSVAITWELPHNVSVYADKAMISTVMRNLISNALKFSHPGGNIGISIEVKSGDVQVTVADQGVGMDQNSIDILFKLDKNFSTTGTNNEKGTGLGLVLCKTFLEKHGGKIWVESEFGKGCQFKFTLPLKQNIKTT